MFTFVFPPRQPPSTPPAEVIAGQHAKLVSSFEAALGSKIPVVVGALETVPVDAGYVFLFDPFPADLVAHVAPHAREELLTRLVPIGIGHNDAFDEVLEPLGVPMAIDSRSVSQAEAQFERQASRSELFGPFGRRDVCARIGATPILRQTARYCYAHSTFGSLAHFVVAYLTEWERVMVAR